MLRKRLPVFIHGQLGIQLGYESILYDQSRKNRAPKSRQQLFFSHKIEINHGRFFLLLLFFCLPYFGRINTTKSGKQPELLLQQGITKLLH